MNQDKLRDAIKMAFREEVIAAHQEYDAVAKRDHQEAADCHRRRRQALNRAGALMDRLFAS